MEGFPGSFKAYDITSDDIITETIYQRKPCYREGRSAVGILDVHGKTNSSKENTS